MHSRNPLLPGLRGRIETARATFTGPAGPLRRGRPSGRRGTMTIYLVALLVTCGAVVLFGISTQRSQVTRQLASLGLSLRALDVAEAALQEISHQNFLQRVLGQEAARTTIETAISNGVHRGGVVHCADHILEVDPALVRASLDPARGIALQGASLRLLEYEPLNGRGLMRYAVTLNRRAGEGTRTLTYVQDFRVHAYDPGLGPDWMFSQEFSPFARRYP